jgi:AraC-like DNA-binding protein
MRTTHINDGWLDTTSTDEREILDLRGEGFGPLLALGRFRYRSATEPLPDQQHARWLVLIFALEGAQHYRLGAARLMLNAGQMLRVLPETRYGSGPWPEQRGSVAWMILDPDPVATTREMGIEAEAAAEVFRRLTDAQRPLVLPQPPLTAELLAGVFAGWGERRRPVERALLRHRLAALLLALAAALAGERAGGRERPGYAAGRIREVMTWLDDNQRNEIRVEELVARSRLPQARFFREFKAVAGVTPKEYVLRLKIEEAAGILEREPARPVTTIAHELGFSSSQYFATVFRRYLRVSPGDYRSSLIT